MEQSYSVGTTNRYAMLFDEEDDPGDVISPTSNKQDKEGPTKSVKGGKDLSKQAKQAKNSSKGKENKEKAAQKQNKVVVLESVNKTAPQDKPNSSGRPKQGGRGPNDRDRNERQGEKFSDRDRNDRQGERSNDRDRNERQGERLDNRRQNDDRPPRSARGGGRPRLSSREKDRENEFGGEDRPPRGRGPRPFREQRGGGRGGGGFRTGKREFERRSGSDKSSIKPVDKREGGGAHNWGRRDEGAEDDWPSEEPEAQLDTQEPVANGEDVQEEKEQAEGQEGEGEEPVQEEEEEPKEMTLDEYKAKQNLEVLKPDSSLQRNVDNSQWKGTVALKKEDEEFFPGTREVIEKPKTSGRVKTTLDPNFYFRDPARRGRGRTNGPGGRGGGPPREDRGPGTRRSFDENRREGGRGGRRFEGGRRGGFGGGRGRSNRRDYAPNVEDESDFPSLGAS